MTEIQKIKVYSSVMLLYTLLTLIFTYPVIMHIGNDLDIGDPALNAWILAWDVHSIFTNPLNLFNANIFYPSTDTLAFSEHLFGDMLIAFPVIVITRNPVLAYNIIFLLSFILSGFGMFLLIDYYLSNKYSAFLGGIIFAFCTIRFAQLWHLQLLTAQWMPFTFLYLDKFLHKSSYKNLILLYIFYVLQVLSGWYDAFYITIALGLYATYIFIKNNTIRMNLTNRSFQLKVVLFLILSVAAIAPFAIPYAKVSNEYGFVRDLNEVSLYSADVADYLLTPPNNILYGGISQPFQANRNWSEHSLFPGLSAILLSLYGLLCIKKFKINGSQKFGLIYRGLSHQSFYLLLLIIAFILSLGTPLHLFGHVIPIDLPYKFLYNYLPGFKSMRVPSRIGIIFIFSLSVLAAYGLNKLIKNKSSTRKAVISLICMTMILLESLYIPIGFAQIPVGSAIPEVYKWLANESGDFAIVELPIAKDGNPMCDSEYLYYSTYHWKKLVNGYSGFLPTYYQDLLNSLQEFPSNNSIDALKSIGVKYIIIHGDKIDFKKLGYITLEINRSESLDLVKSFGRDYVYEMEPKKNLD